MLAVSPVVLRISFVILQQERELPAVRIMIPEEKNMCSLVVECSVVKGNSCYLL